MSWTPGQQVRVAVYMVGFSTSFMMAVVLAFLVVWAARDVVVGVAQVLVVL